MPSRSRRSPERLSLWSRRKFGELDKRTIEAHEERKLIEALSAHVGAPNAAERILIKHAARTLVMLTLLEHRVIETGDFTDLAMRQLVALSNSARLGLQALGIDRPDVQVTAPLEYLAAKRKSAA